MPVTPFRDVLAACARYGLLIAIASIAIALFFSVEPGAALSQPFGAPRPPPDIRATGVVGWILAKQAAFYRELSGLIRAAKTDGSAVWTLLGLSFAYGIFHAAGPGHGKAVISSYLVANGETWRRGIILSFVSAMIQALVAVALVAVAAGLIGVTARKMDATVRWIEIASYGLIALVGARLIWTKGGDLVRAWQASQSPDRATRHVNTHSHDPPDDNDPHHHGHSHAGHSHGPTPEELAGPGGWRRGLSAVIAVGLRPCSGAILVLVFALSQGLFWAGVASAFVIGLGTALTVALIATLAVSARLLAARIAQDRREQGGSLVLRGIEFAAAVVVLFFGLALLAGYIASERMI